MAAKSVPTPAISTDTPPVAASDAPTASEKKYAERVAPILGTASKAVPMPTRNVGRGSKSAYDFSSLTEVGMSLPVLNKTAAQLASVVANANKKAYVQATNPEDGSLQFKTTEMKDANGTVIGTVPTAEPVLTQTAHYFVVEAASDDPDKAKSRIFRDK